MSKTIRLVCGPSVQIAAALCLLQGCATSLSGFRPAHVPRKGGFHAAAGADVSVPTGSINRTIDAAKDFARAAEDRSLTEEEVGTLYEAGMTLAVNAPSLVQHILVAYAPVERTEISARYAGGGWRLGGRYQIWEQGQNGGWDLTAGLGATRQTVSFPIGDIIDVVKLDDYVRWTFDVPVTFGRRGSWYRLWGGPRLLYSRGDAHISLNLPAVAGMPARRESASADTQGWYFGAQSGFAIGYQNVFVGLELNLVQFSGTAALSTPTQRREVDVSTFIIYPGLALMAEF